MLNSIIKILSQNPTVTKIHKMKVRTEGVDNSDSDFFAKSSDVSHSVLIPSQDTFFSVLEKIGSGAFGVIKRALNMQSDKQVVVKIHNVNKALEMQRQLTKCDPEDKSVVGFIESQLEIEENLTKALNRFYGSMFRVNSKGVRKKYLFMEYFKGENLHQRLKGELSVHDKATLALQITQEVKTIHALKYLHLDLSLYNILFDGQVRIIDFGLSAYLNNDSATNGGFRGSHIPPEMFLEHEKEGKCSISAKVDVFALGMIIYEIFSLNTFDPYKYTAYDEYKAHYTSFYQAALRDINTDQDAAPWKKIVSGMILQNPEERVSLDKVIESLKEYATNCHTTGVSIKPRSS